MVIVSVGVAIGSFLTRSLPKFAATFAHKFAKLTLPNETLH